jgi:hypothetical protein
MTPSIIEEAIARITDLNKGRFDYEWRLTMAQELRDKVMESIASGTCVDPVACCKAAIVTLDMDFIGDLAA